MQHSEDWMGRTVWLALCILLLGACGPLPASPSASPLAAPNVTAQVPESPLAQAEVDAALTALPAKWPRACPKLDSRLLQIIEAADPVALAQQFELPILDERIQVVLVLATNDIAFLEPLGVVVGGQAGQEVQAYVPIGQLCELAARSEIAAIRLPDLLVTP